MSKKKPKEKIAELVPPWQQEIKNATPIPHIQLAQDLMAHPEKTIRQLAKDHGMTVYQAESALKTQSIRDMVTNTLDDVGLTARSCVETVQNAMTATEHVTVSITGSGKDKNIQFSEKPDHAIRLKAAELGLRLHRFIGNLNEGTPGGTNVSALIVSIRNERTKRGLPNADHRH